MAFISSISYHILQHLIAATADQTAAHLSLIATLETVSHIRFSSLVHIYEDHILSLRYSIICGAVEEGGRKSPNCKKNTLLIFRLPSSFLSPLPITMGTAVGRSHFLGLLSTLFLATYTIVRHRHHYRSPCGTWPLQLCNCER